MGDGEVRDCWGGRVEDRMTSAKDMMKRDSYKKKIWDYLGSRDFSVFIFVMACTYSVILVIFATVIPLPWVKRIANLLPFKVLYMLFFINLIICEIKWIPVIVRKCRKPKIPKAMEDLQRFRHKIKLRSQGSGVRSFEKYLRWRGYKVKTGVRSQESEENVSCLTYHVSPLLYAYKGRFSPVGNLLFHIAFLLLLFGAWISIFTHFEGTTILMEKQEFMGTREEYSSISARTADLPPIVFRVDRIVPQFWGNQILFTDLKAEVRFPTHGRVHSGVIRLAQPIKINGAKVAVSGIGYIPMFLLKDKAGNILDSGNVNMNIFPPGNEDHFQIPGYPHKIFVSFYPDYEIKDGKIMNRSMDIVNPAYYVKVFRNRVLSFSGILKPGEEIYYDGVGLSFPEFKYWGQFRIVKNPGFIYIWIAFILFGTGLVWKLLFYRKEIAVVKEGAAIYLYGNSDYYQRLFEDRLRMLAEGEV